MTGFYNDSIFWVEVDKINPNPYQPRKEFNEQELQSLADSIRQYGVLQALVVTRSEEVKEDGGLQVTYELISGERRLRASKLAGVRQVPVIIRTGDQSQEMKLELAIIENIQREDLNVVDRARAFKRLIDEFDFSHAQVAKKVGKSREYITNNLRVLSLPQDILDNLSSRKLSEGHARPLMMLVDKPNEQATLHKEIIYKKMSVREAERVARKIAHERTRNKSSYDPQIAQLEKQFSQSLGTRVHIEKKDQGGKLTIDYFSEDDLNNLLDIFKKYGGSTSPTEMMERFIAQKQKQEEGAETADNPKKPNLAEEKSGVEDDLPADSSKPEEVQQSQVNNLVTDEDLENVSESLAGNSANYNQNQETQSAENTRNDLPEESSDEQGDNQSTSVSEENKEFSTIKESFENNSAKEELQPETQESSADTNQSQKDSVEPAGNSSEEKDGEEGDDLYSVRNFTI